MAVHLKIISRHTDYGVIIEVSDMCIMGTKIKAFINIWKVNLILLTENTQLLIV